MNFSNLKNITILNPFKMDNLDKRGGGGGTVLVCYMVLITYIRSYSVFHFLFYKDENSLSNRF